jgi:hypothetical protein
MRSFDVSNFIDFTFPKVFKRKKSKIGSITVKMKREINLAWITSSGIKREDLEK